MLIKISQNAKVLGGSLGSGGGGGGGGIADFIPNVSSAPVLPNFAWSPTPTMPTITPIANGVEVSGDAFLAAANNTILFTPDTNEVAVYGQLLTPLVFNNSPGFEEAGLYTFALANSLPPTQYFIGAQLARDNVDTWYIRDFTQNYGEGFGPYTDAQILNQNIAVSAYFSNGGLDLNFRVRIGGTNVAPAIDQTITYANYVGNFAPDVITNAQFGIAGQNAGQAAGTISWQVNNTPIVAYDGVDQFVETPTITGYPVSDGVYRVTGLGAAAYSGYPDLGSFSNGDVISIVANAPVSRTVRKDVFDPNDDINFGGDNNYTGSQFFGGAVVLGGEIVDKVNFDVIGAEDLGTLGQFFRYGIQLDSATTTATAFLPDKFEPSTNNMVYVDVVVAGYTGGKVTISTDSGDNFYQNGVDTGQTFVELTTGKDIRFMAANTNFGRRWHIIDRTAAGAGGGIGGSTGPADNLVIRSDGAGGSTVQGSGVSLADDGTLSWSGTAMKFSSTSGATFGPGVGPTNWNLTPGQSFSIYDGFSQFLLNSSGINLGANGNLTLTANGGNVLMTSLPTSDPLVSGALWNDLGTVKVSA